MTKCETRSDSLEFAGTPPGRTGFALAELLVAMAVVTILVAMVVPVTIQSRNRARNAACLSNLRQLGGALLTYGQDWNDRLPSLSATPFAASFSSEQRPDGSSATQLRSAISKYVRNGSVYKCGNDRGAPEYGFSSSEGSVFSHTGSSYLPWSATRTGLYGVALNATRVSVHKTASGLCLLRDYGSDWHGYSRRAGLDIEVTTVANAAYADGHSAVVPILSVAISDRAYACCASDRGQNVSISGGAGDVQVELTGSRRIETEVSGQKRLRLRLSGVVGGGGVSYKVDRVFSFDAGIRLDAAFKQVAAWADGLVVR